MRIPKKLWMLIPNEAVMGGAPAKMSYIAGCHGVDDAFGEVYVHPHLYVNDKPHMIGSSSICKQCLRLRKELKKYKVIL